MGITTPKGSSTPQECRTSFDPPSDWRVLDPYREPEVQKQMGMYLRNDAAEVEANVRGYSHTEKHFDAAGMSELVRMQDWPPPPFDESSVTEGDLTWAAATRDAGQWIVREYFVTHGRSVANVALIGKQRERVLLAVPSVEALIRTIRFC